MLRITLILKDRKMDLNCNYVVGRADGCRMVKIGAEFSKEERNVSRWLVEEG